MIQLAANISQGRPARILQGFRARALLHIQTLSAVRAQTLAVVAADRFQGQSKDDLFLQNILQLQSLTLIIADLGLGGSHRKLCLARVSSLRAIQQIELVRHLLQDRFEAASTGQLNPGLQVPAKAYVLYYLMLAVLLFDQLSPSGGMQHFYLSQVFPEIKHTRVNFLFEINGMQLKFVDFDEHQAPPALQKSYREDPRKHALKSKFSRKYLQE